MARQAAWILPIGQHARRATVHPHAEPGWSPPSGLAITPEGARRQRRPAPPHLHRADGDDGLAPHQTPLPRLGPDEEPALGGRPRGAGAELQGPPGTATVQRTAPRSGVWRRATEARGPPSRTVGTSRSRSSSVAPSRDSRGVRTCTFNGGYADVIEAVVGTGATLEASQHGASHIRPVLERSRADNMPARVPIRSAEERHHERDGPQAARVSPGFGHEGGGNLRCQIMLLRSRSGAKAGFRPGASETGEASRGLSGLHRHCLPCRGTLRAVSVK